MAVGISWHVVRLSGGEGLTQEKKIKQVDGDNTKDEKQHENDLGTTGAVVFIICGATG